MIMQRPGKTPFQEAFVKTEQRTVHLIKCDACGATFEALHYPDPGKAWDAAQGYGYCFWPLIGKILCDLCTNKALETIKDQLRRAEIEQACKAGYEPLCIRDDYCQAESCVRMPRTITRTYSEPSL